MATKGMTNTLMTNRYPFRTPTPTTTPTVRTAPRVNPEYTNTLNEINAIKTKLADARIYNDDPNANLREAMLQANENMGTADMGVYGRNKANLFAGYDTGFAKAEDDMNTALARRGIANSGVAVKANLDMANQKAGQYAAMNKQAYDSAVQAGDAYRHQRMANLTGYAQLGRGMSGSAQNYLTGAGQTAQGIAGTAGQTAIGLGNLSNTYNANKWNADAQSSAGKGSMAGSAIGAAAMFSDMRLKKNVKALCKINGFQIVQWDWNEEGIRVTGGNAPTVGVIAQEAAKIDPTAVRVNKETGYLMVDYNKIFTGVRHG